MPTRNKQFELLETRTVLTGSPVALEIDTSIASDPAEFAQLGDLVVFAADDSQTGRELWVSDGTASGTNRISDINPNTNSSAPTDLVVFQGEVYFAADDGSLGRELWKSDGTLAGTTFVADLLTSGSSSPSDLIVVNDRLFFTADSADGRKLWVSDGTAAGTNIVADIVVGGSSNPARLTAVDQTLFFTADDATSGRELWRTDGTETGTFLVSDIATGVTSSSPRQLTVVGDQLFFIADTVDEGLELWRTDGTETGTSLVADVNTGSSDGLDENNEMIAVGNSLFFVADDGASGAELWTTDGTTSGTQLVLDIQSGIASALNAATFELVGSDVFFAADDGSSGTELWKSDGTASGTQLVSDIQGGTGSSSPSNLTAVDGRLFFSADDGANGLELWESDGTVDNTQLVANLAAGSTGSSPSELFALNEFLLFAADDGSGVDAWSVDTSADSVDAPTPNDDAYTTLEDTPLLQDADGGLLSNDPTIDGVTLTAAVATAAANGSVSVSADGQFTYTPDADFFGTDTFTYTLSTTTSTSEPATVTITVESQPEPPIAIDDQFDAQNNGQQQTFDVLANDTDPENGTLTISDVTSGSNGGTTSISNGQIAYTAAANFVGEETFTYTITNDQQETATGTVTVTVTDSSSGNAVTGIVFIDHDASGDQGANEPGIPGVQLTLTSDDDAGLILTTLTDDSGQYRFRNVPEGTYTLTQRQGKAFEDPANPNVTRDVTIGDDTSIAVTGTDTEVTADPVAENKLRSNFHSICWYFSRRSSPQSDSEIFRETLAIAEEDAGNDELAARIRDGDTDTERSGDTNATPVANDDSFTVTVDETLTVTTDNNVLSNDTDAEDDALTSILVDDASNGTLDFSEDGTFTFVSDTVGTVTFTYSASDGTNTSDPATVTITVEDAIQDNIAPVATAESFDVDEDVTLTVSASEGLLANATDADGDALTVRVVNTTTNGQLDVDTADGSFSYVPNTDFSGGDSFTYVANDGTEDSSEVTVTITVNPINDSPVAVVDIFSVDEDTTLTVDADGVLSNDTDVDDTGLTASLVTQTTEGTINLNPDGSFTYTPPADFNGDVTFEYQVSDDDNATAQAIATISVAPVNDAPVAVDDNYEVDEDTVLAIDAAMALLDNDTDIDLDALTAVLVSQPTNGLLTLQPDGTFTYTPDQNFAGTDTFTYVASDAETQSNPATVTIEVRQTEDPGSIILPSEFTNDPDNVAERIAGEQIAFTVIVDDPDDDDQYTYQLDLDNSGIPETASKPVINATTGEVTWTPTETGGAFLIRVIVVNQTDRTADQESFLINILPDDIADN